MYTYDAFGGQTHHLWINPDGTKESGGNQPDQSIVGYLTNAAKPADMVAFLNRNRITSVGVVRAFNACNIPGVATLLGAVAAYPEIAAWYAGQEQVKETVWNIPTPAPTVDLGVQGDALIEAVRAYVTAVRNR